MSKSSAAVAHAMAQAEVNGYAAMKVSDGELVVMTRKGLMSLLATMDEKGDDKVIIFIKHGGEFADEGN